jgi:enamine deaminase RidA (YjgF/YER057c/UK114 family)
MRERFPFYAAGRAFPGVINYAAFNGRGMDMGHEPMGMGRGVWGRWRARGLAACCFGFGAAVFAGTAFAADKVIVIPEKRGVEYDRYRYAPAVRVGDMVIISGIPAGGPGNYREQVRRMFQRISATLEAAGTSMDDVVEIQTFHVNAKSTEDFQKEFAEFVEVHREFFKENLPAWTAIGNAVLLAPGSPVEMKVVAMIGSGKGARIERK